MNREIRDKWVKALRSGNYKQGRGYLKRGNSYCCLGVLATVLGYPSKEMGGIHVFDFNGCKQTSIIPEKASENIELDTNDQMRLAMMNDTTRLSFSRIADWIEENL